MRPAAAVGLLLLAACAGPDAAPDADRAAIESRVASRPAPPPLLAGPVTGIACAGGLTIACSHAGVARLSARQALWPLPFRAVDVALAADGTLLVGGGHPGQNGVVARLDHDGQILAQARVGSDLVYAVALAPDDRQAAAALADGRVLLLTWPSLVIERVALRHTAAARDVAFAPDGRYLASCGLDRLVQIAPVAGGGTLRVAPDHTAGVDCLMFASDGARIASGARDGKVRTHDVTGRLLHTHSGLGAAVWALAPGSKGWIAGLSDGGVVVLPPDQDTGTIVQAADGVAVFALAVEGAGAVALGRVGEISRVKMTP